MIEIYTIGGYDEVGKNMTLIKADDEAVIIDMGLHLDKYIHLTEDSETVEISTPQLLQAGAIPDDSCVKQLAGIVKAIIPTHAHLDHVGALPYMAKKYKCPILATPFTAEVIQTLSKDGNRKIKNDMITMQENTTKRVSENIKIEFINATHSTPQTSMIAVHTKYGTVLYCNDFKFDNTPTLGKKPNYKRLKELGTKGVKVLISDGTRARDAKKTPSESVAREMLKDVMSTLTETKNAIFITTFSSHIARLKSIIELGKNLNRKIVFLGRSLHKYVTAAENINLVKFTDKIELVGFSNQVRRKLRDIEENRDKYLVVLTGHQAEPRAVLSKIADGFLPFHFQRGDYLIFSCTVIPQPSNIANREKLERDLMKAGVRIYKDIHASGHAAREDLRELIEMVKPEHLIPAHGDIKMLTPLEDLAIEMGYEDGKTVHMMRDGDKLNVN